MSVTRPSSGILAEAHHDKREQIVQLLVQAYWM